MAQHRAHGGREEVPLPAGQHVFAQVDAGGSGFPQLFARRRVASAAAAGGQQQVVVVRPVGAGLSPLERPAAGRERRLTFGRGELYGGRDRHDGQQVVQHVDAVARGKTTHQ